MKKNNPAKKGTGAFRGNKSSHAGRNTPGKGGRTSFDAGKPGGDKRDGRPVSGTPDRYKKPFSFDGAKREFGTDGPKREFKKDNRTDAPGGRFAKKSFGTDGPKREFRKDTREDGAGTRFPKKSFGTDGPKREFRKDTREEGTGARFPKKSFDNDRPKREFKPRTSGGDRYPKKPFGTDRDSASRSSDEAPRFRNRFAPESKPAETRKPDNDSDFHGDFKPSSDKKAGGNAKRDTPSGFNRQKFFDKANDRFADKQERTPGKKKHFEDGDKAPRRHKEVREDSDKAPRGRRDEREEGEKAPRRHKEDREEVAGEMPLNKYIAHCGLCSRRKAVDYIKEGKVTVNGVVEKEPAFKVTATDVVKMGDKKITISKNLIYILLNKPKGFITTTDDPEGRQTVMDLITEATQERVYPVGRLDRNTSGLLLLTNDGELAQKLAHPSNNIKKIYQVELDKPLTKAHFEQILAGVTLEDGLASVDMLAYVDNADKKQIGIEIHSGKNRIVRRIFEHLEYTVEKLDRVMYAGLTKKNINRGKWRILSEKEVILLKHFKK
jgi:23S rRNA pseudouridine2605 synthase